MIKLLGFGFKKKKKITLMYGVWYWTLDLNVIKKKNTYYIPRF